MIESRTIDPLKFKDLLWPDVKFCAKQVEAIYSHVEDDETVVPAGNMLGKDFVAGFLALYDILTRHPYRGVTSSAGEDHLRVLWGEINNFIQTAKHPLDSNKGGPLICQHQALYKIYNGKRCPKSYLLGIVAGHDNLDKLAGHHIANTGDGIWRTCWYCDEASSVNDEFYKRVRPWARRMFIFGNPWPCENFFKRAVKGGDIPREGRPGYHRRIIRICAEDSPNVQFAREQQLRGHTPTGEVVVPGLKDWDEYCKNLKLWDKIQQCVSLEGMFYEGSEIKLFPQQWLALCQEAARKLKGSRRVAESIGVDSAEGGDNTSMVAIDRQGVIEIKSCKTPDTNAIPGMVIEFAECRHGVPPDMWWFDRGGGGKQHADRLRAMGYAVRTIGFGETLTPDPKRGLTMIETRKDEKEQRYAYKNRRAEMAALLSEMCDPSLYPEGFAIPEECARLGQNGERDLFFQLDKYPKLYDGEGRMFLPPKRKDPSKREAANRPIKSLEEMIGYSPDEADALVLANFGLNGKVPQPVIAGAF